MKNLLNKLKQGRDIPNALAVAAKRAAKYNDHLYNFGQVTDREFVILADSVSSIQSCIQETVDQTNKLAVSLDGNSQENAFRSAFEVGKRAIELVHSSAGVEFTLNNQFELINQLVVDCEQIKTEFDHNQVIFRSLATGFAIESSRCEVESQNVFKTVVSDFHRIDKSITETLESGFNELRAVLKEMGDIRKAWEKEVNGSENTIERQLEGIRGEIHKIETDLAPCLQDCSEIKESLESIEVAIMPLIVCLQNQDIVRQKLEHVGKALSEIGEIADASSELASGKNRKTRLSELYAHSSVQRKQLDYALGLLQDSSTQAFSGIEGAQGQSNSVAQKLGRLQDLLHRKFGSGNVAFAFGRQIQELSKITEFSERIQKQLSTIDERIVRVVDVYNREISLRQQDIRLIALNAQVAASRLTEGGALERLAQETSLVSNANRSTSSKLSSTLETALEELRVTRDASIAHVEVLNKDRTELFEMSQNIDTLLQNHINGTIRETRELLERSKKNADEIVQLPSRLTFHKRLDSEFVPVQELLEQLQTLSKKHLGKRGMPKEFQATLNEHRNRYTMNTERKLHDETFDQISSENEFISFN